MYDEISVFEANDGTYRAINETNTAEGETPKDAVIAYAEAFL